MRPPRWPVEETLTDRDVAVGEDLPHETSGVTVVELLQARGALVDVETPARACEGRNEGR